MTWLKLLWLLAVPTLAYKTSEWFDACYKDPPCLEGAVCQYFDNGTQTCRCSVDHNEMFCEKIKVSDLSQVPPRIVKQSPVEVFYLQGRGSQLDSTATGHPAPQYMWKKNGYFLDLDSDNRRNLLDNGTLVFSSLSLSDEGFYQCFAENQFGRAMSVISHLAPADLEDLGRVSRRSNESAPLGDAVSLSCPHTDSLPHVIYEWRTEDGDLLPPSSRTMVDRFGSLHFANVMQEDEGIYTCWRLNMVNNVTRKIGEIMLTVMASANSSTTHPPELMFSSSNSTVMLLGSTEELQCFFAGLPTPSVRWHRLNGTMKADTYSARPEGGRLWFDVVSWEHEGKYVCEGFSGEGQGSKHIITVDVQSRPWFGPGEGLRDGNATEGQNVTFNCTTEAEPEAAVQWFINGIPVNSSVLGSRYHISEDGGAFTVENICKRCENGFTDQMVIQCNASNKHGHILSSGYLNVYLPLVITQPPVSQTFSPNYNIRRFSCGVSTDPSREVNITWYDYDPIDLSRKDVIVQEDGSLLLVLDRSSVMDWLSYKYEGIYECEANDGFSYTSASAEFLIGNASGWGESYCDPECSDLGCYGPGPAECGTCRNYVYQGVCRNECDAEELLYVADNHICSQCHPRCTTSCTGPALQDCYKPNRRSFLRNMNILLPLLVLGFLACVAAVAGLWRHHRHPLYRCYGDESTDSLEKWQPDEASEAEEVVEALLGHTADMASLRVITESELCNGNIIGSGAFGVVMRGTWTPPNEKFSVPVAIKALKESAYVSSMCNQELLAEARIMATVQHPYCVRLLAICMSSPMKLITQLLPLGNLLEYIRKRKNRIGCKILLTWCWQISEGMSYLQSRSIVHRDLAARNVLIKTPKHVKITDFGISKMLDNNDKFHTAQNEKVAVRWMAIECLEQRIFSSKSDVWSYGVTLWELFTFGEHPYDDIDIHDIFRHLKEGKRLDKPAICSIDVYMVMLKCWLVDPESRISFQELTDLFRGMTHDPHHYLVIQVGDNVDLPILSSDTEEYIHHIGRKLCEGDISRVLTEDYLEPVPSDGSSEEVVQDGAYTADTGHFVYGHIIGTLHEKYVDETSDHKKTSEVDTQSNLIPLNSCQADARIGATQYGELLDAQLTCSNPLYLDLDPIYLGSCGPA